MDKIVVLLGEKFDVAPFEEIRARYKKSGVTVSNITILLTSLMVQANRVKNMTGSEKKKLVMDILRVTIEENVKDEILEKVLIDMIPGLIDTLVDVSKNKINLKKVSSWCCQ